MRTYNPEASVMTEAIIDQSKRLLAASERILKMLVSNVSASGGTRSAR